MLKQVRKKSCSVGGSEDLQKVQVIIVTGYSGAGKNSMLHSLEDIGFYCINTLPSSLLASFFDSIVQEKIPYRRIALGLDMRGDVTQLLHLLCRFKTVLPFSLKIMFLSCSYGVLLKRFQETRRTHPLAHKGRTVSEAIKEEREKLKPFEQLADIVFDTEQCTIHQLRQFAIKAFAQNASQSMVVTITAFGFKYGVPPESNLVFDVRFLPNPYFNAELKHLSGLDSAIQEYLFSQDQVTEYWEHFSTFALYVIKQSLKEGRFFMNIAIGCTGGRHRSVAIAHTFSQCSLEHVSFITRYRDIQKDSLIKGDV